MHAGGDQKVSVDKTGEHFEAFVGQVAGVDIDSASHPDTLVDVAHDEGISTCVAAMKTKFWTLIQSYSWTGGAAARNVFEVLGLRGTRMVYERLVDDMDVNKWPNCMTEYHTSLLLDAMKMSHE